MHKTRSKKKKFIKPIDKPMEEGRFRPLLIVSYDLYKKLERIMNHAKDKTQKEI